MKKFIILFFLLNSVFGLSQNAIDAKFTDIKNYVRNVLEAHSSSILEYSKFENGKIKLKPKDGFNEDEIGEIVMSYRIIKRNDKIVYISKSDNFWGGMGDWYNAQDFYFDEDGILLGAVKKEDWFLEDTKCAFQVKYRGIYKNYGNPKLDRKDSFYNEKDKEINFESAKCGYVKKIAIETAGNTPKINFRSVEEFMKAENLKYYKENEIVKKEAAIGNLIRGRGIKSNKQDDLEKNENRIGVDRKIIAYIPGTMGRGGNQPKHNCTVTGSVIIIYTVDKSGNVVSARRSGGIGDSCAVSTSVSWIKEYVKAEKSDTSSTGIYRITF